ncbi:DASH family cryptochrome [Limnohabitans sp. G3-2]|uniref:DASH family cryptochrome n=1 Tax=Limnohabitans sp. G3-2 TaxID=1100711 RepID=UPI000C1F8C25|nr:DASH family cryptochrome [Limnohabitans sp. G3-2]PIT75677.1 deoxyribodipyrimidine photolyase [Limnohabitans sp. G3-2]
MRTTLYWFRNDLRLHDQRALQQAIAHAQAHGQALLLVYVHEPVQDEPTAWGFRRMGAHRRRFLADTLQDLQTSLLGLGQRLVLLHGHVAEVLPTCARAVQADTVFCEDIPAPEEQAQVQALIGAGLSVQSLCQSSLIEPGALPFAAADMPQVFTEFRQRIESKGLKPLTPLPAPTQLPAPPIDSLTALPGWTDSPFTLLQAHTGDDAHGRSNFPYTQAPCRGGETRALAHLHNYLTPPWPDRYKQTRNALQGQHTSSHWSPWLATGAVSARRIWAELQAYEHTHGSNDGTYWLWFELLWRDNFRMLHWQHGPQLYAARGLSNLPQPSHFPKDFARWCSGQTGEPIVDAGMRELAATGFTSNRMRQIVASFLVHDLSCDWRAGAAWFESQLVDFDVCSNQGNWLYVSGRGTDPRAGRRFNPSKQTQDHDAQGRYRQVWLA